MHQMHLKLIYSSCFFHVTCKPHKVSLSVASHLIFFLFLPYCISPFIALLCFCRFWLLCHHHRGQETRRSFKQCGLCCDHSGYLSLFLSMCIRREKQTNSTNFIGYGEAHDSGKTSLFNVSKLEVADFACACWLKSMPHIFIVYFLFFLYIYIYTYI